MKRHFFLAASLLLAGVTAYAAGPRSETMNAAEAFSRLKALAGDWEADTQMGKTHLNIQLIAGGTSLVERETGEKMPEMMTVYYVDGDRLLLTHYCMAGNQPRMQASVSPDGKTITFTYVDATNLATPDAGHMQTMVLTLVDDNHHTEEWTFVDHGKELKRFFDLRRKS